MSVNRKVIVPVGKSVGIRGLLVGPQHGRSKHGRPAASILDFGCGGQGIFIAREGAITERLRDALGPCLSGRLQPKLVQQEG
jgi:hypothetical protein